ncbi:MAG: TonB-dependent receptor [Bacteroidota bacterium]
MALLASGTLRSFGDLVGGDTTITQSPSGYDEGAFDLKGKFRLSETTSLTLAHQFFRQVDVPVFHKIRLENFARNHTILQQRQLSYARLEASPNWGSAVQKITATASLHRSGEQRELQKNGSQTLRFEEDEVTSWGASMQAEGKLSEHWQTTTGAEFYFDQVGSERLDTDLGTGAATSKRGLYPDGSTHASAAIFMLNHWETGKWGFFGGLRFNHFSIRVEDETIGKAHLTPAALVWNAAILRHLSKKDNLFASFNTGFRAPNVDDLGSLGIVDFRYELPTADLKPEKTYNFELGWRHRSERLQAEAFVFRNELRDLIARVRVGSDSIAGYPVFQKENFEQGYVQGFEIAANWLIFKNISLQSALAWQYGQNVTSSEPLRRIPPVFGRAGIHFSKNAWSLTLETLAAGKQDRLAAGDKSDNRIPAGGTPGWQEVNVYGDFEWKWLTLRAGIWNVFNEDYRYHGSGVNGMGRSGSVSLMIQVGKQ